MVDHGARIFFCGGDASVATMTHWFPSVPFGASGHDLAPAGPKAKARANLAGLGDVSGYATIPGIYLALIYSWLATLGAKGPTGGFA